MPNVWASRGLRIVPVADSTEYPLIGVVIPHDAFDQGALARAVFTEQRIKPTGSQLKIHIFQGGERAEAFGNSLTLANPEELHRS